MLIKIKELNLPLDEVIYCDIKFSNTLSGEMPAMAEFIPKAEKILQERFGITVKHITSPKTFEEYFYQQKTKGKHIGDIYGFPYTIGAWCNDRLKVSVIAKYLNSFNQPIIQYVGIAYDEPERYKRLSSKGGIIAPLYDLKITEDEAWAICEKHGLLSPVYKTSFRGGCWFCGKQTLSQMKYLYETYPRLWEILKQMEKHSHNTFRPRITLRELEDKFQNGYTPRITRRSKTEIHNNEHI